MSEVAKLRMFEMAKLREEFLGKVTFLIQKLFMILILFFVSAFKFYTRMTERMLISFSCSQMFSYGRRGRTKVVTPGR